ncbi:MAG TPA: DUF1566 domain-containing protein [Candidatus Binatia bacterium]
MKKTTLIVALAAVLVVPLSAAAATPCGDVNNSGKVTSSDALLVLKDAVGQSVQLVCPASGGLPSTGQTTCYDAAGNGISCIGTGQDGELQRGGDRTFTDNGDGTITDDATGLMWEKLSADASIHDVGSTWTWTDAVASKIATLNSDNFAGHHDWRLPNEFELYTLVDLGAPPPSTYPEFNACMAGCTVETCNCTSSTVYWSSTTYAVKTSNAWGINFVGGPTNNVGKADLYNVRAVRGGS